MFQYLYGVNVLVHYVFKDLNYVLNTLRAGTGAMKDLSTSQVVYTCAVSRSAELNCFCTSTTKVFCSQSNTQTDSL